VSIEVEQDVFGLEITIDDVQGVQMVES